MNEFYKIHYHGALASIKRGNDPLVNLRELPLAEFGRLMVQPLVEFPLLVDHLPKPISTQIQTNYNGRANLELLPSSVTFISSVLNAYTQYFEIKFPVGGTVLDYGCGWGRLLRMCYYFTNPNDIYGFDPQQKSINICTQSGIEANLMLCNEIPNVLPSEPNFFDLMFSFSVFTHLSYKATNAILKTLRRYVKPNGMLAITIRPIEFWDYYRSIDRISQDEYEDLLNQHNTTGFAYIPLKKGWKEVEGEVQFGDTSISLDFIKSNWPEWKIVATDLTIEDPYQIYIFLVPA